MTSEPSERSDRSEPSEAPEHDWDDTPVVVSVVQQKGGVGKSVTTANVSGALAARGNDVLAIDMDPQGFLTNKLGFRDAYKRPDEHLAEALLNATEVDIKDVIVEHPEYDLAPSNLDMFSVVQELIANSWRPRERLLMLLDEDERAEHDFDPLGYDFIVVDAPPNLGILSDNVLRATDDLLVPVEADDMMEISLDHLLNQIETVESRYGTSITEQGFVISNVNHPIDAEQREMIHWFARIFRGRCPVYEIRNRVDIKRALQNKGSVFGDESPECDQKWIYDKIAANLEVPK